MEKKNQFRIEKFSCEFSDKNDIEEFCCANNGTPEKNPYDETVFVTDDIKKAEAELEKYESDVSNVNGTYYVTEYYIIEYAYDEELEDYVFIDLYNCSRMTFGGDDE